VTGCGGCAALCCWCVLLTLAVVPPVTSAVEHRTWYAPARLDVKVYPGHSLLSAGEAVTVQCSVRSESRVHRSRLRVGFYVRATLLCAEFEQQ